MPNIMSALKSEITRLARKEAKQIVAPVKKASANYRGLIAGLRKQIDALQSDVAALKRAEPKADKAVLKKQAPAGRFWITGKGVKALRTRLGLTQAQFGKLVGVSSQSVVNWEGAEGKVNLRKAAAGKLQGLRGIGKRQAAEMLGLGKAVNTKAKAQAVNAKRKAKKV